MAATTATGVYNPTIAALPHHQVGHQQLHDVPPAQVTIPQWRDPRRPNSSSASSPSASASTASAITSDSSHDCKQCLNEERRLERRLVPCLPCVTCCWCLRPGGTSKRITSNTGGPSSPSNYRSSRSSGAEDRKGAPTTLPSHSNGSGVEQKTSPPHDGSDSIDNDECCNTGGICGACCATERARVACAQSGWGYGTAQVVVMILLFAILYGVLAIDASDAGTIDCITTSVSVVAQRCSRGTAIAQVQRDCLQSYRRLEWSLPPATVNGSIRTFWHTVAESNCDWNGIETRECGFNSSILLAVARSYLGTNSTCWIYYHSGSYYDPPLAGGRNPEQAMAVYRNVTVAWIPLMLLLGFMYSITRWTNRRYLTKIVTTRIQRHRWHTSPFVAFLLALATAAADKSIMTNTVTITTGSTASATPTPAAITTMTSATGRSSGSSDSMLATLSPRSRNRVSKPTASSSTPILVDAIIPSSTTIQMVPLSSMSVPSSLPSSVASVPVSSPSMSNIRPLSSLHAFVNDPLYDRNIAGLIGEFTWADIAARATEIRQHNQTLLEYANGDGPPPQASSSAPTTTSSTELDQKDHSNINHLNPNVGNGADNTSELVRISYIMEQIRDEMFIE